MIYKICKNFWAGGSVGTRNLTNSDFLCVGVGCVLNKRNYFMNMNEN